MRRSRFLLVMFFSLAALLVTAPSSPAQTVTNLFSFTGTTASENPFAAPAQGRNGELYGTTYGLSYGSVFKVTTAGAGGDLYAFGGPDGANPIGGLTLASDGNFYGTTDTGGSSNLGVLFRITPTGTYTVLHEFSGADGGNPWAAPVLASDGNLYGTTSGYSVPSTVYRYTPSGTLSTIYQFDQAHGGLVNAPLVQGTDGNLYGTAEDGGANNCGTLFKMSRSGAVLNYMSLSCGSSGKLPVGPLIQASDGNFYGVTTEGGGANIGTVFRWSPKGAFTILHQFSGTSNGESPVGLVQATDGKLYGTTTLGGNSGTGVLFSMTTRGVYNVLYSFQSGVGQYPAAPPFQDTNGLLYGTTNLGGANGSGAVYSVSLGLTPFVTFVRPNGGIGHTAQILGQGLTGTTGVTFNGVSATSFTVVNDTYMLAVVPSGATTGKVVVTTPSGTLTSNVSFRILQ